MSLSALFLPNKPTPQFKWQNDWMVKLFYVDYGNIEWVPLDQVRRKKFPYPNGQALRCSLGSITPNVSVYYNFISIINIISSIYNLAMF